MKNTKEIQIKDGQISVLWDILYVPIKDISKVFVKQSDSVMTEWPPHLILYSLDKSQLHKM